MSELEEQCVQCGEIFAHELDECVQCGEPLCPRCYAESPYCADCERKDEREQEEPPEEMWCEYHKLYHWPCF